MLKRTALFEEHVKLGGRVVDFGGWELPVQYSGVMDEHIACRTAAGLFDVSHMGEVHVEGAASEAFVNYLITNDAAKLAVSQALYTEMCNHEGGIVDDLLVYRRAKDRYFLVINASNTEKDYAHMLRIEKEFKQANPQATDLRISNESANYTQIAIQGPNAERITQQLTNVALAPVKYYWFTEGKVLGDIPAIIARTGYTGEDGFELYIPWNKGPEVWRALLETGTPLGMKPVGLGARDTLRLEMKFPLYGHELSEQTNPFAAGVGWVVKLDKGDFVGKAAIIQGKQKGLAVQLVGLKLLERGVPRQGYQIYSEDGRTHLGEVTSGTLSPSLNQAIAIAYVTKGQAANGTRITVDIRGNKIPAEIVPTPFYQRPY